MRNTRKEAKPGDYFEEEEIKESHPGNHGGREGKGEEGRGKGYPSRGEEPINIHYRQLNTEKDREAGIDITLVLTQVDRSA